MDAAICLEVGELEVFLLRLIRRTVTRDYRQATTDILAQAARTSLGIRQLQACRSANQATGSR